MRQAIIALVGSTSRLYAARPAAVSLRRAADPIRAFTASSSALKKAKSSKWNAVEEDFEEEVEQEDDDLFGDVAATESDSAAPTDRSAERAANVKRMVQAARAYQKEGDHKYRNQLALSMRKAALRKIVRASKTEAELEELRNVLRAWRILGREVDEVSADEIISHCCNAGRADLALELAEERIQYGVPFLSNNASTRLHRALLDRSEAPARLPSLEYDAVPPTLAVLRLALHAKSASASSEGSAAEPEAVIKQVEGSVDKSQSEPLSEDDKEAVRAAMKTLQAAGPKWAEAGRRIQPA